MTNESKGLLLGLCGVTAFGLTLPATRYIVPYLDPVFIGLGRAVVAAVCAALILLWRRQPFPTRRQWGLLAVVAAGVVVGFPVLSAWAMQFLPASHGGVMLGILPLATASVGVIVARERPSLYFWLAGAAGSGLVISLALIQGAGNEGDFYMADLALLGAVVAAAIGYGVGGKLSRELGGWQVICWALVLSFPFILWPALLRSPASITALPGGVWGGFFYLALVSQLLGFFWWNKGLALGGIARVSQTQLLQPFITFVASALLLGEAIGWDIIIFALLVAATVGIGRRVPITRQEA